MINKELYDCVFSAVPITSFFPGVIRHWSKEKKVNEATMKKLRRVVKYTIENNLVNAGSDIYRLQLCDGHNLLNAIKMYGSNYWFIRNATSNPNFDEECTITMLDVCEKECPNIFESNSILGERSMILTCKSMPESELRKYAKSDNKYARAEVAANEACPKDVLEDLSKDPALVVRMRVARNRVTPEHVRLELVDDKNPQVRKCVAFNSEGMTQNIIRKLAKYKDEYEVIRAIVKISICPADILEEFASYTNKKPANTYIVRRNVALNQNLSKKGWDILHSDPELCWSNIALASKLCPVELLDTFVPDVKFASNVAYYIMQRDDLNDDVIEKFLNHMGARVRAIVIEEYDLPQETLLKFCKGKSKVVNCAIAKKLQDNEAIMYLLNKYDGNDIDYCCYLVDGLGSGSAEMFIEYIQSHKPEHWTYLVRSYLGYGRCSEDDMWKVFNEFKDCSLTGLKECKFAEELLKAIANRRNLSDYSLEYYINFVLHSEEIENREKMLKQLEGTFYTEIMLDMCIDYIEQQSKEK